MQATAPTQLVDPSGDTGHRSAVRATEVQDVPTGEFEYALLSDRAAIEAFRDEWIAFVAGDVAGLGIENDPRYLLAAASDTDYWLVVARCNGQVRGVAAARRQVQPFTVRFSVFGLFSTSIRELSVCGSSIVLAADCDEAPVLGAIFRTYAQARAEFDWLHLEGVEEGGPLLPGLERIAATAGLRICRRSAAPEPAYVRQLPATHAAFMQSLSGKTRSNLRRYSRRWMSESGVPTPDFVRCTTPADVAPFLAAMDTVFKDTWQGRTYGFDARNIPSEIERLTRIAELGWFRSYLLYLDGEPIAFQLGYQYKGVYHEIRPGYTQRHAKLGAGTALHHMAILDYYERDTPTSMDLGQGTSNNKIEMRAEKRLCHPVHLACNRRVSLLIDGQRLLDRLETTVRRVLERWKLDQRVRHVLKRRGPAASGTVEE